MAAKVTKLTHKIAIKLHLVAQGCTIFSSRAKRPVRKLLDTPSHVAPPIIEALCPVFVDLISISRYSERLYIKLYADLGSCVIDTE
jgi:hypothetical protein